MLLAVGTVCPVHSPVGFPSRESSTPGLLKVGGGGWGGSSLYSQSPDLWHVVEAGDQDSADVVVVEGAAETEEEVMNEGH